MKGTIAEAEAAPPLKKAAANKRTDLMKGLSKENDIDYHSCGESVCLTEESEKRKALYIKAEERQREEREDETARTFT